MQQCAREKKFWLSVSSQMKILYMFIEKAFKAVPDRARRETASEAQTQVP